MDLWNEDIKNNIIENKGSVPYLLSSQKRLEISTNCMEMQMKDIIDMAADPDDIFAKVKVLICGWKIQLTRLLLPCIFMVEEGLKLEFTICEESSTSTPTIHNQTQK